MITEDAVKKDLMAFVAEVHNEELKSIPDDADLIIDLGLSSMDLLQLILEAETRYNIRINPFVFHQRRKVAQIVTIITTIIIEQHGI